MNWGLGSFIVAIVSLTVLLSPIRRWIRTEIFSPYLLHIYEGAFDPHHPDGAVKSHSRPMKIEGDDFNFFRVFTVLLRPKYKSTFEAINVRWVVKGASRYSDADFTEIRIERIRDPYLHNILDEPLTGLPNRFEASSDNIGGWNCCTDLQSLFQEMGVYGFKFQS